MEKKKPILTKSYINEVTSHKETKNKLRKKEIEYTQVEEQLTAMTLERDALQERLNKLDRGFNWYILNDTKHILTAGTVLGGFVTSYPHELPIDINKGYYRLENGNEELDKDKKRQIRGGL